MTTSLIVTFDETWRTHAHRTALPGARRPHPDGFVEILVPDGTAPESMIAFADWIFGKEWTDLRLKDVNDNFRATWPLGCLGVMDAQDPAWPRWRGPM